MRVRELGFMSVTGLLLLAASAWSARMEAAPSVAGLNDATEATVLAPRSVQPLTVAVLGFQCRDQQVADTLTDVTTAALADQPSVALVEREELDRVLQEYQIGFSGLTGTAQAQRIGFLMGAKALIMGRAFVADQQILITAKIVGVETGRVYVKQVRGDQTDQLIPLAETLASEIAATVQSHRDTLCAPDISHERDTRLAAMAESLKGRTLPKVVISVAEQHYGQPVGDPAAETELMLWFKQSGFTIIDLGARRKLLADWVPAYCRGDRSAMAASLPAMVDPGVGIVVVGEGFSELATRIGPLVSCKVKLEVRALDRNTGQVLAIARRTETVVDVSEHAAAKAGLQSAASNVAYELIQQLTPTLPAL